MVTLDKIRKASPRIAASLNTILVNARGKQETYVREGWDTDNPGARGAMVHRLEEAVGEQGRKLLVETVFGIEGGSSKQLKAWHCTSVLQWLDEGGDAIVNEAVDLIRRAEGQLMLSLDGTAAESAREGATGRTREATMAEKTVVQTEASAAGGNGENTSIEKESPINGNKVLANY